MSKFVAKECPYCHQLGGKHAPMYACSMATELEAQTKKLIMFPTRQRGELILEGDPPTELVAFATRWSVG